MRQFWRVEYKRICGVMGTQMGKTDCAANMLGHRLDTDPVPVMYIGPTKIFVERTWEPRFMAMVNSTPLKLKLTPGRQPKSQKQIAGVMATFGWSGSAASLSGETACKVIVDERDRMDDDVSGEGDPVEMADGRHETYPDGQTAIFSTPTIGNIETETHPETGLEHWSMSDDLGSATWKIWQEGTRHEWMIPCPACDEYFAPRFRHLVWPEDTAAEDIKSEDVGLMCTHCAVIIPQSEREDMMARGLAIAPGQWVDKKGRVQGAAPFSLTYSLWVSGLVSPWRDWFEMVLRWLAAVASGDPTRIQGVLNIQFGELYSYTNQAPEWSIVADLRSLTDYPMGTLPPGVDVIAIVLGVDVQMDRLVYIIRAYCHGMTSFLLEHGEIYSEHGGTDADDAWAALALFKDRQFGDDGIRIARAFIDSRYRTPMVFKFVRKHRTWAFPCVGVDSATKPLQRRLVDVNAAGKVVKGGVSRWTLDSDYFKRWIHERIERDPALPGQWHLPVDATDDYCKQIVAEARIVKPSGRIVWKRVRKDNHYLDCEMMGLGCAHSLQVHIKAERDPLPATVVKGGRDTAGQKDKITIRRSTPGSGGRDNWFTRRR